MGVAPFRVDIMLSIPAVHFDEAWGRREALSIGDLLVPFISHRDLLRSKRSGGRPQDAIDALNLEKCDPDR